MLDNGEKLLHNLLLSGSVFRSITAYFLALIPVFPGSSGTCFDKFKIAPGCPEVKYIEQMCRNT
jgi:hypothetical protein